MLLDVCCCLQASQKHDILQECVNTDKKCNQIFFFFPFVRQIFLEFNLPDLQWSPDKLLHTHYFGFDQLLAPHQNFKLNPTLTS